MTTNCTKIVTHSIVKVEQNKRKASFKNPNNVPYAVTEVDECLVKGGIRSDYLVSEVGSTSILVELKGKDVKHACEQLFASVRDPAITPLLEKKIGFLVICSKYPKIDSFVMKAKQKCATEFKAGFHVVCDQREFEIRKVADIKGPY